MKVKFESYLINQVTAVIYQFYKLSKPMQNSVKNFVRLYSEGDGILSFIVNNLDMKLKYNMPIDKKVKIDNYYVIGEFHSIVSNLQNYTEFELDGHKFIYDDGEYVINNYEIDRDKMEEYFNLEEKIAGKDSIKMNVNDNIIQEINDIFSLSDMKSDKDVNRYFNYKNEIYFMFGDVLIKKPIIEPLISTDMFTLRMLYAVLAKNKGIDVFIKQYRDKEDNSKFAMVSEYFYVEGRITNVDQSDVKYLASVFEAIERKIEFGRQTLKLKLGFFNFLSVLTDFDNVSSVVCHDDIAEVKSNIIKSAYFNTGSNIGYSVKDSEGKYTEAFITATEMKKKEKDPTISIEKNIFTTNTYSLFSVFKYVLKNSESVNEIEADLILNKFGRFLSLSGEVNILLIMN